jgi:two-component system sensor histidine kinase RegB
MTSGSAAVRQFAAWLQPVRWATSLVLWSVVAGVWLLPFDLPLREIAPFGVAAAIARTWIAVLVRGDRRLPVWLVTASLVADAALLSGLLEITGGPFNPFVVMYGVYVWLGILLSLPSATVVGVASAIALGWLVFDHLQVHGIDHHRLNDLPTHLVAMWLAGAALAELVAHYVVRSQAALAERQHWLDEARERAARNEHLASLTTLAAGAAHELSTPLATIAVAARELERSAAALSGPSRADPIGDDARLIRTEVDRCQIILDGMSGRAHGDFQTVAELLSPASIAELAKTRLAADQQARLRIEIAADAGTPNAAGLEVVQTVSSLLKNAFDASAADDAVLLRAVQHGPMLRIEVQDNGAGMSPEARRRAGEPFYTTKEAGKGLGLGLFLARTIAERSGGTLQLATGSGTTAILELPTTMAEINA